MTTKIPTVVEARTQILAYLQSKIDEEIRGMTISPVRIVIPWEFMRNQEPKDCPCIELAMQKYRDKGYKVSYDYNKDNHWTVRVSCAPE